MEKVSEAQMVGTIFEKPSPTLNYPALRLTAKQLDYLNDCLKNPKGDPEFAEQDKADGKIDLSRRAIIKQRNPMRMMSLESQLIQESKRFSLLRRPEKTGKMLICFIESHWRRAGGHTRDSA